MSVLKVVDPHFHLWDLSTGNYPGFEKPSVGFVGSNEPIARSYLLDEYLGEGGGEVEVVKAVHVEAIPQDPLAETRYVQAIANSGKLPIWIVANVDLSVASAAGMIEAHVAAAPRLRGIRQILNRHPDKFYTYVERDFLSEPAWRKGVGLLKRHDLSFDMQLYPHQMAEAAKVAAANPDTGFVLNHAGMFADRHLAGWRVWRDGLRTLSRQRNVFVKLSGLGMFDHGWTVDSFRPYVLEVLDAFGVERAMFASNFPVDKLFSDFPTLWRAFAAIVADLSESEQAALFRTNAERVYRL